MVTVDLVLRGCRIATSRGVEEGGIAIDESKVVAVAKEPLLPTADETIDVGGRLVIPGGVDVHVHFMDPGYTYREDWRTGSESAAAGGTTFVVDHGLTSPPSTTPENLAVIRREAERKSIIDFGLNGAVTPHNLDEIPRLAEAGVAGFGEIFMAESVPELETVDDGALLEAFQLIGRLGKVAGVHAENGEIVGHLTEKLKLEGRRDPLAHAEARPVVAEAEAVSRALILAEYAGVRLHIFHLTSEAGVRLVEGAKEAGQRVTAETCPHYLLFTRKDFAEKGPYLRCNPPLRRRGDVEALWDALRRGVVDMVSSDHWPLPSAEKEAGWEDIWRAGCGMPGVETRIPLLLTFGVMKGRISIQRFVKAVAENPARAFGFYPRKGDIRVGSDADLAVIDLGKRVVLRASDMHTKSDFTPYEGLEVQGVPVMTLVRGRVVMREGEILAEPGYGEFIKPLGEDE